MAQQSCGPQRCGGLLSTAPVEQLHMHTADEPAVSLLTETHPDLCASVAPAPGVTIKRTSKLNWHSRPFCLLTCLARYVNFTVFGLVLCKFDDSTFVDLQRVLFSFIRGHDEIRNLLHMSLAMSQHVVLSGNGTSVTVLKLVRRRCRQLGPSNGGQTLRNTRPSRK